jgi:hypothetical protein
MNTTRRNLLLGAPAALLGLDRVGSRLQAAPASTDFGREPVFVYFNEEERTLVAASEIDPQTLIQTGDVQLEIMFQRLRFGTGDSGLLHGLAHGAIYMEIIQNLPRRVAEGRPLASMSLTSFPLFEPGGKPNGKGESGRLANTTMPTQSNAPISLALPGGGGKLALYVFGTAKMEAWMSESPIINQRAVAGVEVSKTRALVANLMLRSRDGRPILQSPPLPFACTTAASSGNEMPLEHLKLSPGQYILIPREQTPELRSELRSLKLTRGFLVPKDAGMLDITPGLVTSVVPAVTYLSLSVSVAPQGKEAEKQ